MRAFRGLVTALLVTSVLTVPRDSAEPAFRPAHTVSYDHYSLSVDGHRLLLWSGEFRVGRGPATPVAPQRTGTGSGTSTRSSPGIR